jgi:hypothetical protein
VNKFAAYLPPWIRAHPKLSLAICAALWLLPPAWRVFQDLADKLPGATDAGEEPSLWKVWAWPRWLLIWFSKVVKTNRLLFAAAVYGLARYGTRWLPWLRQEIPFFLAVYVLLDYAKPGAATNVVDQYEERAGRGEGSVIGPSILDVIRQNL